VPAVIASGLFELGDVRWRVRDAGGEPIAMVVVATVISFTGGLRGDRVAAALPRDELHAGLRGLRVALGTLVPLALLSAGVISN
jgi:hypothetical protein